MEYNPQAVQSYILHRLAGVRPQSKVAGDCTLAPDPGGCALSEDLSEEGASSEEGERRKEERKCVEQVGRRDGNVSAPFVLGLCHEEAAYLIDEG